MSSGVRDSQPTSSRGLPHDIRQKIDTIASRCPRFLFRGHSRTSGGDPRLNTASMITTHAALDGTSPLSIHDMSLDALRSVVTRHLRFDRSLKSMFSSWSQSPFWALAIAAQKCPYEDNDSIMFSVIDTKRLPNTIVYTPALGQVIGTPTRYTWEFLCFGPVYGDGHCAVRLSDLQRYDLRCFKRQIVNTADPEKVAGMVVDVARLFHLRFQLPVAAYFLAIRDETKAVLASTVASGDVPEEWTTDLSITQDGYAHGCTMEEAGLGMSFLRELAAKRRTSVSESVYQVKESERAESIFSEDESSVDSTEAILASDRFPSEVKRLYIDMVGWDVPHTVAGFRSLRPRH